MNDFNSNAVHPMDIFRSELIVKQRSLHGGGITVNYFVEPPDVYEVPPMTHHCLVLQLNHSMRQITRFGEREHDGEMHKGEFFLQPASFAGFYSWQTTDESLLFIIDPVFLTKVAIETECLSPNKIEVHDLVISYCPRIEAIAYSFLREIQTGGLGGKLYTESLANILAVSLLRNQCVFKAKVKESVSGLSSTQTQQVIDYIQAHISRSIRLDEMAQIVCLSSFHFAREFKKSVGVTLGKYVIQQRAEMAKRLLKQKDLTISDVAFDCGFSNQSHLGRVFKKYTGTTPKKYRDEFR